VEGCVRAGGGGVGAGIVSACPKCFQSLGLLRAEDAKVGAFFQHKPCGAVLVIVAAGSPNQLEMRLATEAEKAAS